MVTEDLKGLYENARGLCEWAGKPAFVGRVSVIDNFKGSLPNGIILHILCHKEMNVTLERIKTTPEEFAPDPINDEEGEAMLQAIFNLFQKWSITDDEAATLLDLPVRTYRRWKAGQPGRLNRDLKARLSNLLGIHKALRIIFVEPQRTYDWIKARNKAFGNQTALDIMLGGDLTDLMRVRRYLDAERGAW